MELERIVSVTGIIICIFGTIFHLQGHSVVGPESSFMYANPEWITYGIQIIVIGIVVLASGAAVRMTKRR